MILLVVMIVCLIGVVVIGKVMPKDTPWYANLGIRGVLGAVFIFCLFQTSIVIVGDQEVGHLKRIYMGSSMPQGRIIALPDEKGPQARVLTAGFNFLPLIRITHDIEMLSVVEIKEGTYGFIVAKDGKPMPDGQYIAPAWDNSSNMIDALQFMGYNNDGDYTGPKGTAGPQLTVLKPQVYRINRYLFDVFQGEATDVPIGHVAVVKSNVGEHYTGKPILPTGVENTNLSVPIVPRDYKGVWDYALPPDRYYLNLKAYDITMIPTQIQTWKYIGGYTRRYIDLELDDKGQIKQTKREDVIPFDPEVSADRSVLLRVENWDVFQDARIQVQVTPANAPFVVAAAGGIDKVEDKIMTPTFRSVLRNEAAKNVEDIREVWDEETKKTVEETFMRPRKVLDLLYKREALEQSVEAKLIPEGAKYGLTVMEVRFGDPTVPPELLVPGRRKQLAESLVSTYQQEKLAQQERVKAESERARADQQGTLMRSEIGIKVAENDATARAERGLGEEKYMKSVAAGQEAQANVLGKDKAFELAYIKEVLAAAISEPELIKYPNILVMGQGGGFEGAAAILGASNLNMGLRNTAAPKQ
jgi:hypothetical protein